MKTFLKKIYFILTLVPLLSVSQNNAPCQTIDYYVKETIKLIETQDSAKYTNLANLETMLDVFSVGAKTDTMQLYVYQTLKNNPEKMKKVFGMNFTRLVKTIRTDIKAKTWKIELENYKVTNTEKTDLTEHLTLEINMKINGSSCQIMMYVTKYKKCYYLFEPVDPYLSLE